MLSRKCGVIYKGQINGLNLRPEFCLYLARNQNSAKTGNWKKYSCSFRVCLCCCHTWHLFSFMFHYCLKQGISMWFSQDMNSCLKGSRIVALWSRKETERPSSPALCNMQKHLLCSWSLCRLLLDGREINLPFWVTTCQSKEQGYFLPSKISPAFNKAACCF